MATALRNTLLSLLLVIANFSVLMGQNHIRGVVVDSVSGEPIENVAIQIEGMGKLSDKKGNFSMTNFLQKEGKLRISLLGFATQEFVIQPNRSYNITVRLKAEGIRMNEVTVTKKAKEKYSKKNNPAVELIRKVIAKKHENWLTTQTYYRFTNYEQILFALRNYKANSGLLKSQTYLQKYAQVSPLDGTPLLPYSMREEYYDFYGRNNPIRTKKILLAKNKQGIDANMDNMGMESVMNEIFSDVDVRENNIQIFLTAFVSPLSSSSSVDFYRWYIQDTLEIDGRSCIQLRFLPFNMHDIGFMGNLWVVNDSSHAIRKISLHIPAKANINFVKRMAIEHEFQPLPSGVWVPHKQTTMVNLQILKYGEGYVQKEVTFSNITVGVPNDIAYATSEPLSKLKGYDMRPEAFWQGSRPSVDSSAQRMGAMMKEMNSRVGWRIAFVAADALSSGYFHLNSDLSKNKLDIGTPQTFFSYNKLEGVRLRLTATTTPNFNRHLYLYGYLAYGMRDHRWKYYGETTWAFNKPERTKEEFTRNNFSISYKSDVNELGSEFLQASSDNLVQSIRSNSNSKRTYLKRASAGYIKEWHSGFSISLKGNLSAQTPADDLRFEYVDGNGATTNLNVLKSREASLSLRYARGEKFMQGKRYRIPLPTPRTIFTLTGTHAGVNTTGKRYTKAGFGVEHVSWFPSFGRLKLNLKAEKMWGNRVPYPMLFTPNANSSYTIQEGAFHLVLPFEFIGDQRIDWRIEYHMGGWLLNRIPFVKRLKLREVFGFRGFWGSLSDGNNPAVTSGALLFPSETYAMGKKPYMEYNIGIQNIFSLLRIDYVHRLSYLHHSKINKRGIRVGLQVEF